MKMTSTIIQDADFIAFRDRSPASLHHFLLIPKIHIGAFHSKWSYCTRFLFSAHLYIIDSVKNLTKQDTDMGTVFSLPFTPELTFSSK
jgi:hypothetical protein